MSKTTLAATAAAGLLALAGAVQAHGQSLGALRIGHPWSPPAPAGAPTAAGYLTVTNTGRTADRLLGAASPAVDHIEIHEMSMDGAVMRMRAVPSGVAVAPGQTLTLGPVGYHLMLVGPKRRFMAGDRIPAVLRFQRAGTIAVDFHVQAASPTEGHAAMERH